MNIEKIMSSLEAKHPGESEYLQAVKEVLLSIEDIYNQHPEFEKAKIIERLVEPDRIFTFRVTWVDDKGEVQTNLGYRVQFNNAIGPYKGGIRFHASVNLSILKFLGFEQTFKNALTTLPMGGGKGGSDFSPRGKSDAEIMRFCQAFMLELWRHLGPDMDVPAGDIGVGGREVGYMFGMYKKLTREFTGTFTGKGLEFGGSLIRPEATGFGGLYFVNQMLQTKGIDIKGKTVAISGFGNVAWGAATKATELGAKVVTISGPDGYIYDPNGISGEKIDYMLELRASGNDIVAPYADEFPGSTFVAGKRPWEVKADIALPWRHSKRIEWRRCQEPDRQQRSLCRRDLQYGLYTRSYRSLYRTQNNVRSRQSCQCRRCGNIRTRNVTKCNALELECSRGRRKTAFYHARHSCTMCEVWYRARRIYQLCKRCQYCRFYESSPCNDGTRNHLIITCPLT